MKKNLFILSSLLLLLIFSCQSPLEFENSNDADDDLVARELAEGLINNENGAIAEANDLVNLFESDKIIRERTIVISTENGELNNFEWDEESKSYIRTGFNLDITTDNFSGVINSFTATATFYLSEDASGDGVNLTVVGKENVKSMKYTREISANLIHIIRSISKDVDISLELILTEINDGVEGVLINGSRVANVSGSTPKMFGNWELTHDFTDVTLYREKEDNVVYDYFEGHVSINFNGSYYGDGWSKTVNKSAEIDFKRERTVTITIDGNTITIDIKTGTVIG